MLLLCTIDCLLAMSEFSQRRAIEREISRRILTRGYLLHLRSSNSGLISDRTLSNKVGIKKMLLPLKFTSRQRGSK